MDFIKFLTDEHKSIRRALDVLKAMTQRGEQGECLDRHDVNALLVFLHYFGDGCHQAKEESILLPALQPSKNRTASVEPEVLLKGHQEERNLIEETQRTLLTDKYLEFIGSARRLIDLLSEHMTKEESVLFPAAEQILTQEEAKEIGSRMQEADANFGYRQRKLLLDMLQQLADKYIRKAA